jgi:hypothetical protein
MQLYGGPKGRAKPTEGKLEYKMKGEEKDLMMTRMMVREIERVCVCV